MRRCAHVALCWWRVVGRCQQHQLHMHKQPARNQSGKNARERACVHFLVAAHRAELYARFCVCVCMCVEYSSARLYPKRESNMSSSSCAEPPRTIDLPDVDLSSSSSYSQDVARKTHTHSYASRTDARRGVRLGRGDVVSFAVNIRARALEFGKINCGFRFTRKEARRKSTTRIARHVAPFRFVVSNAKQLWGGPPTLRPSVCLSVFVRRGAHALRACLFVRRRQRRRRATTTRRGDCGSHKLTHT